MSLKADSILIASNNAHKLQEFREIFTQFGAGEIELIAPDQLGISLDPDETADSYHENALIKARAFHVLISNERRTNSRRNLWVMADDSGLEVDALGGRPGIRSARYHGSAPDKDGSAALLREMAGIPDDQRTARFRAVIAVVDPAGVEYAFDGVCEGSIGCGKRGSGGFGFDPVFRVSGDPRHLAELSALDKHRISHRGLAAQRLIAFLKA
jgi:XTP/dITP diphosphohydrolase